MTVNLREIIGVYPICNTGAVLLHEINYAEDTVKVSMNGYHKTNCKLVEKEVDGELETGFNYSGMFIPLADVMRF